MSVELDLRSYLIGPGAASSACSSSFTFVGPMRPANDRYPAKAVSIFEQGGLKPQPFISNNARKTFKRADVQIRVRGAIGTYLQTKSHADTVWNALNRPSTASVSTASTTYISIEPFQSAPSSFGENDEEQPEFVFTVRAYYETSI